MPKETLNAAQVKEMILHMADKIIEAEPILTDADRALGDGDHGTGMKRGMTSVKDKLGPVEFETCDKVFQTTAMAMISSMGGASGAIFGTLFLAGGKAVGDKGTFGSEELATFFTAAAEGVMTRGGAKPGDKTMVDALVPAGEAAKESTGKPLPGAITAVADAAEAGKEASKDMIATMGRARTLGEKTLGHPDAGAVSVAIITAAMRDYIIA